MIDLLLIYLVSMSCKLIVSTSPMVETKYGVIRGERVLFDKTNLVDVFMGIPYARPPINELRFALPKPLIPWNLTDSELELNATLPKNACIQDSRNLTVAISEDCLFLNIWRPTNPLNCSINQNKQMCLRTTMFYIHGGSFTSGSSFLDMFDGRALVSIGDVILVTINYRLNLFSFITGNSAETPGNLAYFDQLLALEWVNENIINFGGDANKITLFGQSAGAFSVGAFIVSPIVMSLNKTLFNRAILESASPYTYTGLYFREQTNYRDKSKAIAKGVGCEGDEWFDCLRGISALTILNYSVSSQISFFAPLQGFGDDFNPVKTVSAFKTGKFIKNIDLMFGMTRDEGPSFVALFNPIGFLQMFSNNFNKSMAEDVINNLILYPEVNKKLIVDYYMSLVNDNNSTDALRKAVYDVIGDYYITCPTYLFGKEFATHSSTNKIFGYILTHRLTIPVSEVCRRAEWMGVCHSDDVGYIFGLPLRYPNIYSNTDTIISRIMIKSWAAFAKTGDPNTEEINAYWPQYTEQNMKNKYFELNLYMNNTIENPFEDNCDNIWAKYFNNSIKICNISLSVILVTLLLYMFLIFM